jgi:hypothetical protein
MNKNLTYPLPGLNQRGSRNKHFPFGGNGKGGRLEETEKKVDFGETGKGVVYKTWI